MKVLILISIIFVALYGFGDSDVTRPEDETRILSRKKRFLIFPDGSSFQLVFCTASHGYLQVGDIVWFGNTAALAWELPTDPQIFEMFKDKEKEHGQRRQDSKLLVFLDEDGKVISTKPYKRKPIVNPAFAKRSISDMNEVNIIKNISINKMHETQKIASLNIFQNVDENSIHFHREGRKNIYEKLEKFLQALGLHGKECVLRMLCESGKVKQNQGTFYEEILRATFTMPRHDKSDFELNEYDIAHRSDGACAELYSKCQESSTRI